MKQYLELLNDIICYGSSSTDRTGVGTIKLLGSQMRFDLQKGFPAVTTKKLAWKSVVSELLWMLEGSTDERRLAEILYEQPRENLIGKKTIWTANADAQGKQLGHINTELQKELGPVYGWQWRNFNKAYKNTNGSIYGVDQIAEIVKLLKSDPDSRRIILSAWNPAQQSAMALPPCHLLCQFVVLNNKLNCILYIRSNDLFLGAPFNIASYALLTHILARDASLRVGTLIYNIGDAHIYTNHIDQVKEQINRKPKELPTLLISDSFCLKNRLEKGIQLNDTSLFTLHNYSYHPAIKGSMAV